MEGALLVGGMLETKPHVHSLLHREDRVLALIHGTRPSTEGSLYLFGVLCSQCHLQAEFTSIP